MDEEVVRLLLKQLKIVSHRAIALGLTTLLLVTGCASLPNVKDTLHYYYLSHDQEPPKIVGPHGELPKAQSEAILKRMNKQAASTGLLAKQAALMESISESPLVVGNKVTLLQGGDATFAAMFRAVANASDSINVETYIFDDDRIGRVFAELLLQKHARGVAVNVIYDSYGCSSTPGKFFGRLREGGVQVLEFNPINPFRSRGGWMIDERDHRKILIVDGKLVITGGVNISSVHSNEASGSFVRSKSFAPWHDTDVEIVGPVVAEYQRLFIKQWQDQGGPAMAARDYLPTLKPQGPDLVRVLANSPGEWNRQMYIAYVSAVAFSEKSIHLANAYFAPDKQMLRALLEAARRGVDVKIILPGVSDSKLAYYGARSYYTELLQAGVKVFEFRNSMLHSKIAVIDGVWSSVGSTNLDPWSLIRNDEVNAVILGRNFADKMEAVFTKFLSGCDEIHLAVWKKRPVSERMREWFSSLVWFML